MAIDGFDFTTISDGRVDPDSPLDTTLTTDYRDNSEFLMRWLGKSFLPAAVADHDHDGVNSKLIGAIAADIGGTAIAEETGTGDVSVVVTHSLGRAPISIWGTLHVKDSGDDTVRAFRFSLKVSGNVARSLGYSWGNTFGDNNEHPEVNSGGSNQQPAANANTAGEIGSRNQTNISADGATNRFTLESIGATTFTIRCQNLAATNSFSCMFYYS